MKARYDVIVVGAGIMGAATAHAAARRGRSVLLLDRFDIGHRRGSSHGRSRIFRFSYPQESYVRMAQEALPLWRRLEAETGVDLLQSTGGFDMGDGAEANLRALETCGADAEMLTAEEVAARWPHISIPADSTALYSPDTAVVHADRAWRAVARRAVDLGTVLRTNTRVSSVDRGGSVTLEDGTIERGRTVVVTAGAWARPLLAEAGVEIEVRPTRETIAYFAIPEEPVPAVVEWSDPLIYALTSPGHGLKVGEHIAGPVADPNEAGEPDEASVQRLRSWVARCWPTASPEPIQVETCFYTNTADESFILERHEDLVVGSPCSGHGFKFAPLIGERLADL